MVKLNWLRNDYWFLLWFSLFVCLGRIGQLHGAQQPNVLMIMVDDLNDWIGCLGGHPQAKTPNMDALAQRGVLFTQAHCVAPACRPSRTAIFTGKLPSKTGAWTNASDDVIADLAIEQLLPGYFSLHGYETLGTGKLLHGGRLHLFDQGYQTEQRWSPFTRKRVEYTVAEQPTKGSNHPRHVVPDGPAGEEIALPLNGLPSERQPDTRSGESFDWGPLKVADTAMGDTRITDWAIEQLRQRRNQPFFMAVGYYRPHIPLYAPARDFELLPPVQEIHLPEILARDLSDVSQEARRWAREPVTAGTHHQVEASGQWADAVRAYLASVHFVDRQMGRLVAALDASPHADRTIIVLMSDHGWHLGEKEHWGKWTGWAESTRIPLILVPPLDPTSPQFGQRCEEPVSLLDIFPTLVDLCHLPPAPWLDGVTLRPQLENPGQQAGRHVLTWFDAGNVVLTSRHWRYLHYADGSEELYASSREDPGQWFNLAGQPQMHERLHRLRAMVLEAN